MSGSWVVVHEGKDSARHVVGYEGKPQARRRMAEESSRIVMAGGWIRVDQYADHTMLYAKGEWWMAMPRAEYEEQSTPA